MNICIFYTSPKLGDLILQLPFIKAISDRYNTKVSICINKHLSIKEILKNQEYIKHVIESPFRRGKFFLYDLFILSKELKKKNFDQVFILEKTKGPALASIFSGIKKIYGFGIGSQKIFVNRSVNLDKDDLKYNYTKQSGIFLNKLNIKFNFQDKFLILERDYTNLFEEKFKDFPRPWVCFGVDSTEKNRIWPQKNFAHLADRLITNNSVKTIFVINAQNYENYFQNIILKSDYQKNFIDCKKFNRNEIIQIIGMCDYFVGIDSGPSCVSGALQKKTFCIIGATDKTLPRFSSMTKITSHLYDSLREIGNKRCGDNFIQNDYEVKSIKTKDVYDVIVKELY